MRVGLLASALLGIATLLALGGCGTELAPPPRPVAVAPELSGADLKEAVPTPRTVIRFRHGAEVLAVGCAPGGEEWLSGGLDGQVHAWRFGEHLPTATFPGLTGAVIDLAFASAGDQFLMRDRERVDVCRFETGELISTRPAERAPTTAAALSPDGGLLASGDRSGRLCTVATSESTGSADCIQAHPDGVLGIGFDSAGEELWTAGADGTVARWKVQTLVELSRFETVSSADAVAAFSPVGLVLMSGGRTPMVCLWEVATGEKRLCLGDGEEALWVSSLAISDDGRRALTGGVDGGVITWELESGRAVGSTGLGSLVHAVAYCPGGRRAVAGTESGLLATWIPHGA